MQDMEHKDANIVVEETSNEKLLISSLMAHSEESEPGHIDSGCSTHVTSQGELLTKMNENNFGKSIFGDDSVS